MQQRNDDDQIHYFVIYKDHTRHDFINKKPMIQFSSSLQKIWMRKTEHYNFNILKYSPPNDISSSDEKVNPNIFNSTQRKTRNTLKITKHTLIAKTIMFPNKIMSLCCCANASNENNYVFRNLNFSSKLEFAANFPATARPPSPQVRIVLRKTTWIGFQIWAQTLRYKIRT